MYKVIVFIPGLILYFFSFTAFAQNISFDFSNAENGANNPCITAAEYEIIEERCSENIRLFKIGNSQQQRTLPVSLNWPLQPANGLNDCGYYYISAHVDQNPAASAIQDYNCGTVTYDGHRGTDIVNYPFPFVKMDNDQVEVIAAAAGTIIDKSDGNFDRNCGTNSLTANYVVIQHSDGSRILYFHMKKNSLTAKTVGQTVAVGEYLGVVGSSGNSSAPHLHFEVWSGSTNATVNDPFSGSCNALNANSWWASQKPYKETAVIKASINSTDIVVPGCPTTETPNESSTFLIPFQGTGLPAGYARFYIFFRHETNGMTADLKILNPNGSTFTSWTQASTVDYKASFRGWSKLLPTVPGTYTFQATYNGTTCSKSFTVETATGGISNSDFKQLHIYPNPTNGTIHISGSGIENGEYQFILKNIVGQVVFEEFDIVENNPVQKTFNILKLPEGIYFLTIETEKTRRVIKVIKQ